MEETAFFVKTTPFASRETDRIVYDRTEQKSSIKEKISRRFLKEPEVLVLEALRRYKFLNACLLGSILVRDIGYPRDSVKQLLNRLTKGRFITRFRVAYTDAFHKEHRSSYIYTLADSIFRDGEVEMLSRTAFSYLAFNQFHIAVTRKYHGVINSYYSKGRDTVDGAVSFTSEGKRVTINVVTIRRGAESGAYATEILRDSVKGDRVRGTLLVLCESELHALEIERYRKHIEGVREICTFYLCDHATAGDGFLFDHVIRVMDGGHEYEVCSIPVDDTGLK